MVTKTDLQSADPLTTTTEQVNPEDPNPTPEVTFDFPTGNREMFPGLPESVEVRAFEGLDDDDDLRTGYWYLLVPKNRPDDNSEPSWQVRLTPQELSFNDTFHYSIKPEYVSAPSGEILPMEPAEFSMEVKDGVEPARAFGDAAEKAVEVAQKIVDGDIPVQPNI